MNIYDKRWNAVLSFCKDRLLPAMATSDVEAFYEGEKISAEAICIDCAARDIVVVSDNIQFGVYNGNIKWDEGAHDKISDTMARMEQSFKLYKRISY